MTNVYIRPTALSNVRGRINYISSTEKQENLVAVYSSVDEKFWIDLSEHCRKAAEEAGHKKVCEGREWHGALPNAYAEIYAGDEKKLAKEISILLEKVTRTKNVTAIHWNKTKTNLHFHSVCSENKEINEVCYGAVLTRNTYYNASGKRASKKECVGSDGELLPGCELLLKGDRKKTIKRFGTKENLREPELNELIKKLLANKFNQDLQTEEYQVFSDTGIHLKQQHIGKNLPEEKQEKIKEKNNMVKDYNKTVDALLELSLLDGTDTNLEMQKVLKSARNDIKKHALSDNWLNAIHYYRDKLKKIVVDLYKHLSVKTKKTTSLDEKIRAGKETTLTNKKPLKNKDNDLEI